MILKLFVINQCQAAQAPPLETILNSYANVFIAIFTAAAVLIAALQFREAIRGANMKLLFADNALAFIGPANLDDIERAIFFSLALVVVNEGPKVGTITNLRLKMLFPDPQTMIKRDAMEDAYSFSFRFESEEATNAPVPAFSVNGNSSEIIRVRCAITKQNVSPGNSRPPVADLLRAKVKIEANYVKVSGGKCVDVTVDREFALIPGVYDDAAVRLRREFLRL